MGDEREKGEREKREALTTWEPDPSGTHQGRQLQRVEIARRAAKTIVGTGY